MPDTKLLVELERKKVLSNRGTPMIATYVELGDVRLYNDGCVVLGERFAIT